MRWLAARVRGAVNSGVEGLIWLGVASGATAVAVFLWKERSKDITFAGLGACGRPRDSVRPLARASYSAMAKERRLGNSCESRRRGRSRRHLLETHLRHSRHATE